MTEIGQPFMIQNTDGPNWLVTWNEAVTHTGGEVVSFKVAVPRNAGLSIEAIQRYALKRAVELLQADRLLKQG